MQQNDSLADACFFLRRVSCMGPVGACTQTDTPRYVSRKRLCFPLSLSRSRSFSGVHRSGQEWAGVAIGETVILLKLPLHPC